MKYNKNFDELKENYLFAEVAKRTTRFVSSNSDKKIINLGIGDITQPLAPCIVKAGVQAITEMGNYSGIKGYSDYEGYEFLRKAVSEYYSNRNVNLALNEIFIGDGAKSDMATILKIFRKSTALIPNPVYPAYLDTNILCGNAVIFACGSEENNFLPMPDGRQCDLIYICSPSNPTGAVYSREQLKCWVEYALRNNAVILYDAAYERYIEGDYPHSIFEIEGAEQCAIEFGSLSKSAGFTGVRCGWTIIPSCQKANSLYLRHRSASYNGTPYMVQRMAEAALSKQGLKETNEQIQKYKENTKFIARELDKRGVYYTGGIHSPYIWLKTGQNSWDFFDMMLEKYGIVGTPGSGFGSMGEGYFRISAYGLKI